MTLPETPGAPILPTPRRRRSYRLVFLAGGIALWFGAVTITHHRAEERARGTNKGAAELLQIGALPVT